MASNELSESIYDTLIDNLDRSLMQPVQQSQNHDTTQHRSLEVSPSQSSQMMVGSNVQTAQANPPALQDATKPYQGLRTNPINLRPRPSQPFHSSQIFRPEQTGESGPPIEVEDPRIKVEEPVTGALPALSKLPIFQALQEFEVSRPKQQDHLRAPRTPADSAAMPIQDSAVHASISHPKAHSRTPGRVAGSQVSQDPQPPRQHSGKSVGKIGRRLAYMHDRQMIDSSQLDLSQLAIPRPVKVKTISGKITWRSHKPWITDLDAKNPDILFSRQQYGDIYDIAVQKNHDVIKAYWKSTPEALSNELALKIQEFKHMLRNATSLQAYKTRKLEVALRDAVRKQFWPAIDGIAQKISSETNRTPEAVKKNAFDQIKISAICEGKSAKAKAKRDRVRELEKEAKRRAKICKKKVQAESSLTKKSRRGRGGPAMAGSFRTASNAISLGNSRRTNNQAKHQEEQSNWLESQDHNDLPPSQNNHSKFYSNYHSMYQNESMVGMMQADENMEWNEHAQLDDHGPEKHPEYASNENDSDDDDSMEDYHDAQDIGYNAAEV